MEGRSIMSSLIIQDTIKSSPLADDLTSEEIAAIAGISEIRSLEDHEFLAVEGDQDNYLYIIISGTLAVLKKMPQGDPEILCRLQANDLAGISGFIDGQRRLAYMQSFGESEVLAISRDKFQGLINTHPHAVYKTMCVLVKEGLDIVRRLNENIVELNDYFKQVNSHY